MQLRCVIRALQARLQELTQLTGVPLTLTKRARTCVAQPLEALRDKRAILEHVRERRIGGKCARGADEVLLRLGQLLGLRGDRGSEGLEYLALPRSLALTEARQRNPRRKLERALRERRQAEGL